MRKGTRPFMFFVEPKTVWAWEWGQDFLHYHVSALSLYYYRFCQLWYVGGVFSFQCYNMINYSGVHWQVMYWHTIYVHLAQLSQALATLSSGLWKIIFKSKSPWAYWVKQRRTRMEIWDRSSGIGRLKLNWALNLCPTLHWQGLPQIPWLGELCQSWISLATCLL